MCTDCINSLELVDPACVCPQCNALTGNNMLCGRCLQTPFAFSALYSAYFYNSMAKYLLWQLKFYHQLAFLPQLGTLFLERIKAYVSEEPPEVLVPVPLYRWRLFTRGFNQAHELARYIGKGMQLKVDPFLIEKIKATKAQALLSTKARQHNLQGSFKVKAGQLPQSVLLIDDVFTTGATVNALAQALIQRGVARVRVATLFRAC